MQKINFDKEALLWSTLSGLCVFLAFERFNIVPLILFFPFCFNRLILRCNTFWQAFRWGFFTSFVIMLGGFYWVVYVLHEFGYLPWSVATLLFFGFCGFGALNFPLFSGVATFLNQRSKKYKALWFVLGLPALFTVIEYLIPKLFPWYVGHCLYRQTTLIQISELTGSSALTFLLYSTGSTLQASLFPRDKKISPLFLGVPAILWGVVLAFGWSRTHFYLPETKPLKVALVQANIGSLEKVQAEQGMGDRVRYVVDTYKRLTENTLKESPADLVLWPETAMPFPLESAHHYSREVRSFIERQRTAFIIGGYEQSKRNALRDHNSAFLFESNEKALQISSYQKIILLAFGEYLPLGENYPRLYTLFPQIADFERGLSQKPFILQDGTRLGITICYEAIVPRFFRNTAREGVNGVVNLTNDSWFGPTSEPFLHGSLTVFRSVESRLPLMRVTNTGNSFIVDSLGRMSEMTLPFTRTVLRQTVYLPVVPPQTFYIKWGDWFIILCVALVLLTGRPRASLPL